MNNMKTTLLSTVVAGLLSVTTAIAATNDDRELCIPGGYVIGFYNGVYNTQSEARLGLLALQRATVGNLHRDEDVSYELFYSQSAASLEDAIGSYQQQVNGAIANGMDPVIDGRLENFWELINSPTYQPKRLATFVKSIPQIDDGVLTLFNDFNNSVIDNAITGISELRNTWWDSEQSGNVRHITRTKALLLEKKKLVMVAHSQGILYAKTARHESITAETENSIRLIQIAPFATYDNLEYPENINSYIAANIDQIAPLIPQEPDMYLVPANVTLPEEHLATDDHTAHSFIDTYLNRQRSTRSMLRNKVLQDLDQVVAPTIGGNTGFFTATLTWDRTGDVDLHVYEPNGHHVYFNHERGNSGHLDVDNREGFGPEHYLANCNASRLQTGTYRIGINHFAGAIGGTAVVQVATARDGEIYTESFDVGPERFLNGNLEPMPVVEIQVSKDDDNEFIARVAPRH